MSKTPKDKKTDKPTELAADELEQVRGAGWLRRSTAAATAKTVRAQQGRVVLDADHND